MRYLTIVIALIFSFGSFCCAQTQSPSEVQITKKKKGKKKRRKRRRRSSPSKRRKPQRKIRKNVSRGPKILLDKALCANTDDEKNTFELKTATYKCVLKGKNAEAYLVNREPDICTEIEKHITCTTGTKKYREVGLRTGRSISACATACVDKDWKLNGPSAKISLDLKRLISKGMYKNGTKVGHWEYGPWHCRSCPRRTSEVSNYNKKGQLSGTQWKWRRNGTLSSKIVYSKGKLISEESFSRRAPLSSFGRRTRTLFKDGVAIEIKKWHRAGMNKTVFDKTGRRITSYDLFGDIISTGRFERGDVRGRWGVKEGIWKTFYSGEVVKSIRQYRHGRLHGPFRRYDRSGALLDSGTYLSNSEKRGRSRLRARKVGRWVSFYFKDSPKFIENYDNKGIPDGKFCRWDNQGELIRCSLMRAGTGIFYTYSSDEPEERYEMIPLKNNKTHGTRVQFVDGKKWSESEWRNGEKHGLSITYSFNFKREQFRNGKRDGESCQASDELLNYGDYCQGKKCGLWIRQRKEETQKTIFNASGKKLKTETYPTPKNATFECPLR